MPLRPAPRRFSLHRRNLMLAAPAVLVAGASPALALTRTPSQAEGPFYPRAIPTDSDADLSVYEGQRAPGEVIEMAGRVFSTTGQPAAGAEVQIWHCDPNGAYAHVGQPTLPNFQGYGAVRADTGGHYRFRTTLPGVYPGRVRHIHVKARQPEGRVLTTQMYFPGEPDNERDGILRRASNPDALIARLEPGPPPRYLFDIVVA